jgi:uncharacterized protein (DUF952 family)
MFPGVLGLCCVSRCRELRIVHLRHMYPIPDFLLHLCEWPEWDAARVAGKLCPPSLRENGFVHLSAPHQVHLPATRLFAGRTDLLLLHIDPNAVGSPIKWEPGVPSDPTAMLFPHLYGPLPIDAVFDTMSYLPLPDGSFPEYRGHRVV